MEIGKGASPPQENGTTVFVDLQSISVTYQSPGIKLALRVSLLDHLIQTHSDITQLSHLQVIPSSN